MVGQVDRCLTYAAGSGERVYQAMKPPTTTKECDVIYRPIRRELKGKKVSYVVAGIICR